MTAANSPQTQNSDSHVGCPAGDPNLTVAANAEPSTFDRVSTGRLSVVSALRQDPFWPTRISVPTITGAARGFGRPTPLPPGPKGLPVVGSLLPLRKDPFLFMRSHAAKYGDIFRIPLPLLDLVAVTDPVAVGEIFDDSNQRYSRYQPISWLTSVGGANTIMLEGSKLRQRRKMLMPMFARKHVVKIAEILSEEFAVRIDGWSRWAAEGTPLDLQPEISQLTLASFMRALFSSSITAAQIRQMDADLRMITRLLGMTTMMVPFPLLLPMRGRSNLLAAMRRIYQLIGKLIADRAAQPTNNPDFLDALLEARYDDGSPISGKDLAAEIVGLIGAAYDPTSAALTWTLALLLQSPEHLATVYDEVDRLGGAQPTYDDLSKLTWTRACFDEGQRLQGHPFLPRFCMTDNVVGGYRLPKYTLVGAPISVIHRDPRWWPNPDVYDPNRFVDDHQISARPRLAFMPFGSGQHFCLGTTLAYMTAQFFLVSVFQRYRLQLPTGYKPDHHFTFSVTVKGGLPVTLTET